MAHTGGPRSLSSFIFGILLLLLFFFIFLKIPRRPARVYTRAPSHSNHPFRSRQAHTYIFFLADILLFILNLFFPPFFVFSKFKKKRKRGREVLPPDRRNSLRHFGRGTDLSNDVLIGSLRSVLALALCVWRKGLSYMYISS